MDFSRVLINVYSEGKDSLSDRRKLVLDCYPFRFVHSFSSVS